MKKNYDASDLENKWYQIWESSGAFKAADANQHYCIVLPPPNVTGTLHMGHAFQDTLMDILIRSHRMQDFGTLWQVGTDHAGIATQMVVDRQLSAQGLSRHELGREAFVEKVWEWKETSGNAIVGQMRRLGASADWDRQRFTMDEGLSSAVTDVFVSLHEQGLIYRGKRLVNWDPVLKTAVSDLEVVSEDEAGKLVHLEYPLEDGSGKICVATTRPETIFGDVAVAVHPEDERYQSLIGKNCILPLCNRPIPIIADDAVLIEFGTGCVKVTPAHDFTDNEIGNRHGLEPINILNPDASLNDVVPTPYRQLDRYDARKQVLVDLQALGCVQKIEDYTIKTPRGDRTGVVLEPYLTDQWFVSIDSLAKPAIDIVKNKQIQFVPQNWENTYFDWMNNIQDWCISRQLWWGHRIPAWYTDDGQIFVGTSEAHVREKHQLPDDIVLRQDEDVLDTWFSSALWPFSALGWPEDTDMLEKFYPTNVLVTGFDIIFFWVARMIMFGLAFKKEIPFKQIYVHGLIQDSHGQKMSKSKGNVIDPIDLIDGIALEPLVEKRLKGLMQPQMAKKIEKSTRQDYPDGIPAFGVDAVRFTFCAIASNTRHIRFDLPRLEGYRNFINKLWNASRYIMMQLPETPTVLSAPKSDRSVIDRWIVSKLQTLIKETDQYLKDYRFDLAASAFYEFTWHTFCDWYLELTKPVLQNKAASEAERLSTLTTLITVLDTLCEHLHPIIPYITEEIAEAINPYCRSNSSLLITRRRRDFDSNLVDMQAEQQVELLQQSIEALRNIRGELNIAPSKPVTVACKTDDAAIQDNLQQMETLLCRLAKIETLSWVDKPDSLGPCASAVAGNCAFYVPLAGLVDVEQEMARAEKEIARLKQEIDRFDKKLSNKNYTEKAPEAVVKETEAKREAAASALEKMDAVISQLKALG
jgi:valyl-tRNA synthetase